jgi:hypothetical protein
VSKRKERLYGATILLKIIITIYRGHFLPPSFFKKFSKAEEFKVEDLFPRFLFFRILPSHSPVKQLASPSETRT